MANTIQKTTRNLTTYQIIEIWNLHNMRYRDMQIAERLHIPRDTVYWCIKRVEILLEKARSGEMVSHISSSYKNAVAIIISRTPGKHEKVPVVSITEKQPDKTDIYQDMSEAYTLFTEKIQVFIESVVDEKVNTVKEELEDQRKINKELMEKLEKGKVANWVAHLRDKYSIK